MAESKVWNVSFHDEFDSEFDAFAPDVQDALLAVAEALRKLALLPTDLTLGR